MQDEDQVGRDGFAFEGNWREYAPIAFTNLLLTIVTLGIYRFWATTRSRRYFWENTRFIDDHLEWTGKGFELFLGFVMALVLIGGPVLFLNFGVQALILHGHPLFAMLTALFAFLLLFYMVGLARFRAVRYRLGRTWWHGIRGGSEDSGLRYGVSYVWKTFVGSFLLGLLVPWSMMSLWNERWNAMSFGPHRFEAAGDYRNVFKRFLLFYLFPILVLIGSFVFGAVMVAMQSGAPQGEAPDPDSLVSQLAFVGMAIGIYAALGLIALAYYAKFFREAVDELSLADLNFHFYARTKDWVMLILVDILLVIGTLGIGAIFLDYRHWKFFITNLGATGSIDTDALTQSTTSLARHGEGLLDALDVGAF